LVYGVNVTRKTAADPSKWGEVPMIWASRWLSLGSIGWATVAFSAAAATSPCNTPPPALQRGQHGVDAEALSFSFRSQAYPVAIYSSFAPQVNSNPSNFCIRYEAENTGTSPIEKFYWPLASEMEMDSFEPGPHERQSIVVTRPPGRQPHIEESWVFAFLSGAVSSFAYQQQHVLADPSKIPDTAAQNFSGRAPHGILLAAGGPLQVAQEAITGPGYVLENGNRYTFKEKAGLPDVGVTFNGSGAEVIASTNADWDGRTLFITTTIERNDSKFASVVKAPVALALIKSSAASDILPNVNEIERESAELPLSGNSFKATAKFGTEGAPPRLYILNQPISFQRPNGRVCFLAPTYSPIPLPTRLLSCDKV
jgi:hypothetical protein